MRKPEKQAIQLKPNPGQQEAFLKTSADIAIYGGAAGGGKSYALLLEPLRHIENKEFGAVYLRRTTPQITNQGALWDESMKIYPLVGGEPRESYLEWTFPKGSSVKFAHMEHEKDKHNYQGSQIPLICFDELTHFSKSQFMYMLSRNRSSCGIRPYIRATCNPDSESWVREFIDWWIDPESGYPIKERSGVIRYFIVINDEVIWRDSRQELLDEYRDSMPIVDGVQQDVLPLSFTFIPAKLTDNPELMKADPGYMAKLNALPFIERERLLGGNWNVSAGDGIIKKDWIRYYECLPEVRYYIWSWDTAIKEGQSNDFSVGQYWAVCDQGYFLVFQHKVKYAYPKLKRLVWESFQNNKSREVLIEDKSSGSQLVQDFRDIPVEFQGQGIALPIIKMMPGSNMLPDKESRMHLASTPFETGRVFVPNPASFGNEWVRETILNWIKFPNGVHDDECDSMSQFMARESKRASMSNDDIGIPVIVSLYAGYGQEY